MRLDAMDPLLADVPERMDTERLVLRCARHGDGTAVHEAVSTSIERLRPWLPWARAEATAEETEVTVGRMRAAFMSREDLALLMFERQADGSEGSYVGGTGLHRIDWTVPFFEIGYWCRTGFQGRGLAVEAVHALTRLAFDRLAAARVEIRMDDENLSSQRVAERAGYTFEGLLRCDSRGPAGRLRNTRVYARVRSDEGPLIEDAVATR
jgi:ribosomal-protein-serine acetyltransferase